VLSASYEVIAWNHLATALMEDFSVLSRRDRNLIRRVFLVHARVPDGCTPQTPTCSHGVRRTICERQRRGTRTIRRPRS